MTNYEKYQLLWMLDHGHSLDELVRELHEMQCEDPEDSDRTSTPISELFSEWEQDRGFGGELWACEAEWEENEGRDSRIEELWAEFEDVPMNPNTECIEEAFLDFPAGTDRYTIWEWFEKNHSKGVRYLLYGDGGAELSPETLLERNAIAAEYECESRDCAFNECGNCRFPLVSGRAPRLSDDEGCLDGCIDLGNDWHHA